MTPTSPLSTRAGIAITIKPRPSRLGANVQPLATPQAAARVALAAATAVVVLLASLHVLSPEFDPAWRVVSEYANGRFGWVLSLLFLGWATCCWALPFALRPHVQTARGKLGLACLVVSGVGAAMASVFAIEHPLHNLASLLGVLGFPFAAMLISSSLAQTASSSAAKKLHWTAHLTWMGVVLMVGTLILMIITYMEAVGGQTANSAEVTALPAGVIALVGYANRLLVVLNCLWVVTVARHVLELGTRRS
jgi:hypothetical membrane protein